jgi:5-methyltetrahydrofolate--homocysteine methyltransferase
VSASKIKEASSLRLALGKRVVIADGAMGTMIQSANPSLDDFQGLEGCNEVLNITRPELIADIHRQYFSAGVDAVETNTFGANLANLGEYDIPERIYELAEAGARIARGVADEFTISSGEPNFQLLDTSRMRIFVQHIKKHLGVLLMGDQMRY